MGLNKVNPDDVLKCVTFNTEDSNWKYDENKRDIYTYQAQGVAGIINRLNAYKLAILADEVGMGKTYQALGVVACEVQKKRDFKVLIISPRKEVMTQWIAEYDTFINNHLKEDLKKQFTDIKYGELNSFSTDNIDNVDNNAQIVFAQTNSFSQNVDIKNLIEKFENFDMFIIDEAHKYRNLGENKRTKNAQELFSTFKDKKILLMSATPLHGSTQDIINILKVFKIDKEFDLSEYTHEHLEVINKKIMNKYMIRRLRIICDKNKYDYRKEEPIEADFSSQNNNFRDELFYAILQKRLVVSDTKKDLSKSKNLLDLFEGTTFNKEYLEHYNNDGSNPQKESDKIIDDIFVETLNDFQNIYGKNSFPSNQKYNKILEKIEDTEEKALVFVRRRASAVELISKYLDVFDKKWWKYLSGNENYPKNRKLFDKSLGIELSQTKLDKFINTKYIKNEYKVKSKRENLAIEFYSIYDNLNSENFELFKKDQNLKPDVIEEEKNVKNFPKSYILDAFKKETEASRFISKFNNIKGYEDFFEDFLPLKLNYSDKDDNIKKTIKSAVLHASVGCIELFKCYREAHTFKSNGVVPKAHYVYKRFLIKVEKGIKNNEFEFVQQIKDFLQHFPSYEKAMGLNKSANDSEKQKNRGVGLKDKDYEKFYNAQPAYAYLSNTKNENVLARFNSPFFPNLLCGTSTLQEGLNLHVHCNKVYHFGAANSMGDDEQRVGRVDRIHGKMQRELENKELSNPKLDIYYPYLENSFDEENLKNMLCSKRSTEEKIDRCELAANAVIQTEKFKCDKSINELLNEYDNRDTTNYGEPFTWKMK